MKPLPTVVRETCMFRDDESATVIESRIAETKKRALEIAAREGITRPHFSELYHPDSYDDLEAGRGWRKPARNWREALEECICGRYARYVAIVRNQDYCDWLDSQDLTSKPKRGRVTQT